MNLNKYSTSTLAKKTFCLTLGKLRLQNSILLINGESLNKPPQYTKMNG